MSYDSDAESISSKPVTTNTLLGFVDVEISEDEPIYSNDSFIGGQPIPMDKNSPIPYELVHCKNCNKPMRLLTQCSADLPNTWYDRSLYVFICIESRCRRKDGSIRAIRGIKKDKQIMEKRENDEKKRIKEEKLKEQKKIEKEEETKKLVANLFGSSNDDSSNPFGNSSNPFASKSNPFETKKINDEVNKINDTKSSFAEIAKSATTENDKPKKKLETNYTLPEFKGYILYFETENLDPSKQKLPPIPDNLKIEEVDGEVEDTLNNNNSNNIKNGNLPKINPEKNKETEDLTKLFDDQTFQNFTRILSYNTQQVLRYEPNGSPILYSSKDKTSKIFYTEGGKFKEKKDWNIPSPAYHVTGERRFEMQLMPKMIIDLENNYNDVKQIIDNGMEWGTIVVATDSEDFVPVNWLDNNGVAYLEEWCGVQWEESVGN